MIALYDVVYYYDSSMNFDDDDFKVVGNSWHIIKLSTYEDSVAAIL